MTFALGDVYLVKYLADDQWYRARVTGVVKSNVEGAADTVEVLYIDYGNQESVPATR